MRGRGTGYRERPACGHGVFEPSKAGQRTKVRW
jgi:hypothetical protein